MTLLENIIAVEVPEGAKNVHVHNVPDDWTPLISWQHNNDNWHDKLPPGNWQFLFCTADASEEQAAGIVGGAITISLGEVELFGVYKSFTGDALYCDTAKQSLQSLLSSKGLKKNYAVLKKII